MKKFKVSASILACGLMFASISPSFAEASNNKSNETTCSCNEIPDFSTGTPIDPNFTGPVGDQTVNGILYSKYHINATQASKIGKALAGGAGAAARRIKQRDFGRHPGFRQEINENGETNDKHGKDDGNKRNAQEKFLTC
ncbi:hypothetical protein ACQKKK_19735 [Peribacillus sp. NPDC006672]|uniref:hypothetical protein n=1 Tax=Peribacillus sp. NPDC006672 TaxID=3390606 RepID=UPI003D07DFF2